MNKKQVMSLFKKLTAGVLAVGMVVAGIVAYPKQADAEDTVSIPDKVIYELYEAEDIATNYWTADSKTAPVKEGYVFGGWFKQVETETADTETFISDDGATTTHYAPLTTVSGAAYAKFVPAQVLSVKAQNEGKVDADYIDGLSQKIANGGTITDDEAFYVRVMSSLDSKNYQKVGFDIYLGNWKKVYKDEAAKTPTETTKIYTGLKEGDTTKTATQIFGGESEYLSVWQLTKINHPGNVGLIIYVRPYWYTMDGTKVEGLAKYVHIEDEYEGYISVPVNLLNKEDVAEVAAGAVNVTYTNANEGETVALTFKEVEAGRLLPEMAARQDGNTIQMVGNAKTVGECNSDETLYANIRFQKPEDSTTDVDVDFSMTMIKFCKWDETEVKINEKWDIEYVK